MAQPLNYEPTFPRANYQLKTNVEIDQHIKDDYNEAGRCIGSQCFKASLVMSRRALQRILTAQGCEQNKLVKQIDHAIKNEILRPQFHELATEIREYGNLSAHPDDEQLENANRESAKQILDFARLLIQDFYELPAQITSLKHKRKDPGAT